MTDGELIVEHDVRENVRRKEDKWVHLLRQHVEEHRVKISSSCSGACML